MKNPEQTAPASSRLTDASPWLRPTAKSGMGLFTLLWLGQTLSQLGSGLLGFALGVMVFQQTGSVTRFALIGLAIALPTLLLSPLAGVLADRWDRRRLLVLANAGSALANLVLLALIRAGHLELWHVYPVIVASACCMAFVWPAFSAATTLLVGKANLARASGMNQMGASIAQILAPAIAGIMLVSIGIDGIVSLNIATYLVVIAILLLSRLPQPTASREGKGAKGSVGEQTRHAWRFIRQRPGLLWLLILFAGVNFTLAMLTVLLTPLVLGFASPSVLGIVLSIASSGMLVGGILMSVWGGPAKRVGVILPVIVAMGCLALAAGLQPSATLVATFSFLFLLGFPIVASCGQAIWQAKVPADLQGRVFAVRRMVAGVAAPAAYIFAGPLADQVFEPLMAPSGLFASTLGPWIGVGPGRGIALLIMCLGIVMMVAAVAGASSRSLRHLEEEIPDALEDQPSQRVAVHLGQSPGSKQPPAAFDLLAVRHAVLLGCVLAGTTLLALWGHRPPNALGLDAPAAAFSAARAQRHVEILAATPHPVGSVAQHRARDYLLRELRELGFEAGVQRTADVRVLENIGVTHLVRVENVVARLPGTASRRDSVLLAAHYDSTPSTPGAGDNASSVAALLETARALGHGEPLANNVILLFTDAEEVGLNGARAFVRSHPWAADVGFVLNFDARGHGGPVYMFESGDGNSRWIPHLKATPRPLGSSLLNSIYELLPNDTDFTVFREAGYPGFNFAFIEGLTHYHTMLDRPEDLAPETLQHQGSYALSLLRHFGQLDLSKARHGPEDSAPNSVYFDVLGRWLVHYPAILGYALLALATLGLAGLLSVGLRRGRLSPFGIGQGFLALLGMLVAIPVVVTVVWLLTRDFADLPMLMGSTPHAARYMIALTLLALAGVAACLRFLGRLASAPDLTAGALLWWWLLAVLASGPWLPVEANFLFVWPLLFALLAFGVLVLQPARPWLLTGVLALASLPALILWTPMVASVYVGLQSLAELGGVALVAAVLLAGLLLPQLVALTRRGPWLPRLALVAGAATLASALHASSATSLDVSSVLYRLDADTQEATWASQDPSPSPWTATFGFTTEQRAPMAPFFPRLRSPWLSAPAPTAPLLASQLEIQPRTREGELWRHELKLRAGDGARARLLWVEPASAGVSLHFEDATVALRTRDGKPAQIVVELPIARAEEDLVLRTRGEDPVTLHVVEQHEGLPRLPGILERPPEEIPRPFLSVIRTDVSLVRKTFELDVSSASLGSP